MSPEAKYLRSDLLIVSSASVRLTTDLEIGNVRKVSEKPTRDRLMLQHQKQII